LSTLKLKVQAVMISTTFFDSNLNLDPGVDLKETNLQKNKAKKMAKKTPCKTTLLS
jgi:hypothetical protein